MKSIYDCDFDDLRKHDVWKVRRPPEFLLKIRPDHDSRGAQQTCTVDLHVKCSKRYPLVAPELELINAKGVSDDSIAILKHELHQVSKSKLGEEMVVDLAQHVSRFVLYKIFPLFYLSDSFHF